MTAHTITASATGYASGSQAQTIRADVPNLMAFTTAPQAVGAGSCSGTTTVQQQDAYGNAATQATARAVSLSSTSATTRFYPTNACAAGAARRAALADRRSRNGRLAGAFARGAINDDPRLKPYRRSMWGTGLAIAGIGVVVAALLILVT